MADLKSLEHPTLKVMNFKCCILLVGDMTCVFKKLSSIVFSYASALLQCILAFVSGLAYTIVFTDQDKIYTLNWLLQFGST